MGKHKSKSNNQRVVWVCLDCAYLSGKTDANLDKKSARWNDESCCICHRRKPVLAAGVWGYFTPDQAAQARTKLKELGLDRKTFANPADAAKLVGVVEMVLNEGMSEATKEMLNIVTSKLAKSEPIEVYLTKQLTYAFTQDVAAQQEVARVKKEAQDAVKPKRTKRSIAVVEGGVEQELVADGESKAV